MSNTYYSENSLTRVVLRSSSSAPNSSRDVPSCATALFLGEGNFSFTHALLRIDDVTMRDYYFGGGISGRNQSAQQCIVLPNRIVATSFDQRSELEEKYPEIVPLFNHFEKFSRSVQLRHGVNAVLLDQRADASVSNSEADQKYDWVCWNHPHLGTEDCRMHKFLLHHFLASAKSVLKDETGQIIVALVTGQAERWGIEEVAAKFGLFLESCINFESDRFPGYVCKRNKTGKSFKNMETKRQWVPGQQGGSENDTLESSSMQSYVFRFGLHQMSNGPLRDDRKLSGPVEQAAAPSNEEDSAGPDTMAETETTSPAQGGVSSNVHSREECQAIPNSNGAADRRLECLQCGKQFRNAQGLQTHTRQVHELKMYSKHVQRCTYCDRTFSDKDALFQHVINKHESTYSVGTGGAPAETLSSSGTASGGLRNLQEEEVRLSKATGDSHLLRDKPQWWSEQIDVRMEAVGCKKISYPQQLTGDENGDTGGEQRPLVQDTAILDRVRHLKEVEGVARVWPEEGFYACPTCGQSVPMEWDLNDHLDTLKPLLGVQAECRLCGKRFIEHRALKQHLNYCCRRHHRSQEKE